MTTAERAAETSTIAGLNVLQWTGTGPVVLCLPGLGGSGAGWRFLARALPDAHLVAPDPRGRGGSQQVGGPTGLRQHAQDMAKVLEELDLRDVVVVGHSMGAYLAPLVAQESDRVARLVLVDGGLRPSFPFFLGPRLTRIAFGRQLRSNDRAWPSLEAVAKKGRVGKMVAGQPELEALVMESLAEEFVQGPDGFRPRLDVDHAVADAIDCFHGPDNRALATVRVPAHAVLATNKLKPGEKPFIDDKAVAAFAGTPGLTTERIPGNHVTVLYSEQVLAAVRGDR